MNPFRKHRSGGYQIAAATHRHIKRADRIRDARDWAGAAAAYHAALMIEPGLDHIWVQYGHAQKELGEWQLAEDAYCTAAGLTDDDADPGFQYGRLLNERGRPQEAIEPLLLALSADPSNGDVTRLLQDVIAHAWATDRRALLRNLRERLAAWDRPGNAFARQLREALVRVNGTDATMRPPPGIVYDASDLIAYFDNARLPTGIQRVQLEIIQSAVAEPDAHVRICCFVAARGNWLSVPIDQFKALAALSVAGGDRSEKGWQEALALLRFTMALSPDFRFAQGDALVNLGTSWWLQNYFLYVREAKRRYGIRYVPFVHDLIPIKTPEHCIAELTQDFISWILGVFGHADHFLANSKATRRDLIEVAATLGHAIDNDDVTVIPLDAAFRALVAAMETPLAPKGVDDSPFVLFVSTVESRKGHAVAFDAWAELIARHGDAVPRLVCVGGRGWLNAHIHARLEDEKLASRIEIRSGLSDAELQRLYDTCLFTLYPSLYEGWGLPVTESLCHGKVPLLTDSSSLPEAGGAFAVYVTPGSVDELAAAAERLSFDTAYRDGLERKIAAEFRPRDWSDLAAQIGTALAPAFSADAPAPIEPPQPLAKLGAWYALGRNRSRRIWPGIGTADIFRTGLGWRESEDWGCRTAGRKGGRLRILVPQAAQGPCRLFIGLRGAPHDATFATITIPGLPDTTRLLDANAYGGITLDMPAIPDTGLIVTIRGDYPETAALEGARMTDRSLPIGVTGFALCAAEDIAQRLAIGEAIALDYYDPIDPFAEPPESRRAGFRRSIEAQKLAQQRLQPIQRPGVRPV